MTFYQREDAMKKMSHLIRGKDVEIEALKNKNESLMGVLRNADDNDATSKEIENLMKKLDENRTVIECLKNDKEQILSAYNQLEHSVVVLKSTFESLQASYDQEKNLMTKATQIYNTQEDITANHELEIATLRNLVSKIRQKAPSTGMQLGSREAPDGAESQNSAQVTLSVTSNGVGEVQNSNFSDNEMLTSSVRNLKERCSALEAKNTAMKRDNDALRDQLMDRREKWDALEITNKNLATEVANRDSQLTELNSEISVLQFEISQKQNLLTAFEKDQKELSRLRNHLVTVEEEHGQEVLRLQESELKLQEQVEALRAGLNDLTGATNDLQEQKLGAAH